MDLWAETTLCLKGMLLLRGCTRVISVIGDRDQAQSVAVDLAEDGPERRGSLCRQGSLPRLRHVVQIHGPQSFPRRLRAKTVAVAPSYHTLCSRGTKML